MSQCSVCGHRSAKTIDSLLVAGRTRRSLAAEFGVGYDAMKRHVRNLHVIVPVTPPPWSPAAPPPDLADGTNPLAALVEEMRIKATTTNNPSYAREYRLALEAMAKAPAAPCPEVNLEETPEWIELRERIMAVLDRFPDAKAEMRKALAYPERD